MLNTLKTGSALDNRGEDRHNGVEAQRPSPSSKPGYPVLSAGRALLRQWGTVRPFSAMPTRVSALTPPPICVPVAVIAPGC